MFVSSFYKCWFAFTQCLFSTAESLALKTGVGNLFLLPCDDIFKKIQLDLDSYVFLLNCSLALNSLSERVESPDQNLAYI